MMMYIAATLLGLVVVVSASEGTSDDEDRQRPYPYSRLIYHGQYRGRCDRDGLYYSDSISFIICSNSQAFKQPCPPGTRNSQLGNYGAGGRFDSRDFCDVNMVDYGFNDVKQTRERYGLDDDEEDPAKDAFPRGDSGFQGGHNMYPTYRRRYVYEAPVASGFKPEKGYYYKVEKFYRTEEDALKSIS